jgi:hypothetical protein
MKTAILAENEVQVHHSVRPDVNREFLVVECPNGWPDVAKLVNKVLLFEERRFIYTGWNSDRNECFFSKPLRGEVPVAKIFP